MPSDDPLCGSQSHSQGYFKSDLAACGMERVNGIPVRLLGGTGSSVTVIGIGGHTLGTLADRGEAIRIVRAAIDEGVNFMDNAWCYHGGVSEEIMGSALKGGYRDRVFLMTKNHGRDAATFRRQLEESLGRLRTDFVDLVQFHNIVREADPERLVSGGALDAALDARAAGKVRFIGFTGHHWPHLFQRMLDSGFGWDTVQLPVNPLDAHFRSFTSAVLPLLVERNIGVIGMKVFSGGSIFETGVSAGEAISYSLSLPVSTLVLGIDSVRQLAENLEIIRSWSPLPDGERQRILDRVAPWAGDGHLERYKMDPE